MLNAKLLCGNVALFLNGYHTCLQLAATFFTCRLLLFALQFNKLIGKAEIISTLQTSNDLAIQESLRNSL